MRALLLVAPLLLVLRGAALAQEPSTDALAPGLDPKTVRAFDLPADKGESIAIVWPAARGERPEERAAAGTATASPDYEYVVTIHAKGAPLEAAKLPAFGGWQEDIAFKFGMTAYFSKEHAVVIDPLALMSPRDVADAALDVTAAAERVTIALGADAIDEAKEILKRLKVHTAADLDLYPNAIDDIGIEVILDREFTISLGVRPPGSPTTRTIATIPGVRPVPNWFDAKRANTLFVLLFVGGAIFYFIRLAHKNPNLYLRRIGGLDAIDEALGRATEMGKPVLFVHGLETLQKVPTIAAINILGEVAKKVAAYDTRLICTNYDPIVLTVSQETVKEGFLRAGRPDAYNQDDVFLAGAEQFSYVAAVDGIMLRRKPAANIYAGYFYAESLLLAETGASTGAIQIAATDAYTQLPFFVTTCDYTLMGEELYAASAYLSRDPPLLGSLRGQDLGKAAVIAAILLGTIEATVRTLGGGGGPIDFLLKTVVRQ